MPGNPKPEKVQVEVCCDEKDCEETTILGLQEYNYMNWYCEKHKGNKLKRGDKRTK